MKDLTRTFIITALLLCRSTLPFSQDVKTLSTGEPGGKIVYARQGTTDPAEMRRTIFNNRLVRRLYEPIRN
ncbi:hypothetical protein [Hufsiella ginkgonis]|uniref:Uncharacterized protein n=1 Tax=Hufsiella ginkgonis TaxID=2695274 RepID=A0A7K1XZL4_9SPHI|nr:hypothetical protein [Hufsiella ginkgonis]MXV16451.1 hypothetical protein [Hufsiella ginkgonis]